MQSYIFDAVRTPRGKARPDGALADVPPQELVRQLIEAIDDRVGGEVHRVDALILGCVGQVGAQGGNVALLAKLHSGLAASSPSPTRADTKSSCAASTCGTTALTPDSRQPSPSDTALVVIAASLPRPLGSSCAKTCEAGR